MKTNQIMFLNIRGCAVVNDNHILPVTWMILASAIHVAINKQKSLFYDKL